MNPQKQEQFTVYTAEAVIPRYQRAWVWGLAALVILLCGLAAGWLMGGAGIALRDGAPSSSRRAVDGVALLAQREAANDELRARIGRLEQALRSDPCAPAALEALPPASR